MANIYPTLHVAAFVDGSGPFRQKYHRIDLYWIVALVNSLIDSQMGPSKPLLAPIGPGTKPKQCDHAHQSRWKNKSHKWAKNKTKVVRIGFSGFWFWNPTAVILEFWNSNHGRAQILIIPDHGRIEFFNPKHGRDPSSESQPQSRWIFESHHR